MRGRYRFAPDIWEPAYPAFTEVETQTLHCGQCNKAVDAAPMIAHRTVGGVIEIAGYRWVCPHCGDGIGAVVPAASGDEVAGVRLSALAAYEVPRPPQRNSERVKRKRRNAHGRSGAVAKLTDADIAQIRSLYASGGYTQVQIAAMFGLARYHVRDIVNDDTITDGHTFDMVDNRRRGDGVNTAKLDEAQVREIRRLAAAGMKHKDIAARFGIHRRSISKIIAGRSWAHVT